MSLISTTFRDVIIALVVVAAVVTLVLWNRIPGPRPVRYAARGGLLLVGEGLATLALLVSLNISYGGLVVSWQDLLGDQTTKGAQFSGQAGQVALHPVATVTARSLLHLAVGQAEPSRHTEGRRVVSLTGTTFQWLTILAAIVVSVGIVPAWNRVRGPRPVRILSLVAMLATGYSLAAVAVLVSINISYGGLIATWGDLFDNLSAHSTANPGGRGGRFGNGHFGPGGPGHFGNGHFPPPGAHFTRPPAPP